MKYAQAVMLLVACLFLAPASGMAAQTSVEFNIATGQSSSTAYGLNVRQTYEPWISTSAFQLSPMAVLGAHVWDRSDDTVWGASVAPGLKFDLFTSAAFQPYLAGTVGGAVVSDENFGPRDLGSHFLFQTKGMVGVQFGEGLRHRIQGEYTNYSTWGITGDDDGYHTYGLNYGYSF